MKILYVSSLVFRKSSSASMRNVSLIEGLLDEGHEIDILTIRYPDNLIDEYLVEKLSSNKNVKVYSTEIPLLSKYYKFQHDGKEKKKNIIKKIVPINLIKKIYKAIYLFPDVDKNWIDIYDNKVLNSDYDLLISSSDTKTSHFVAENIVKNKGIKWVQIWGDPWEFDINLNYLERKKASYYEKKLLKEADFIFYVSNPTMLQMKNHYPLFSQKMNFVGRSYLTKIVGREIGSQPEWKMIYTGNINNYRNFNHILQAISVYNKNNSKKVKLKFFGNINIETEKEIKKFEFTEIKGVIPFKDIMNEYMNCDILLYIDNGGNTTQVPGKLFDYIGTDRPVLALVDNFEDSTTDYIKKFDRLMIYKNDSDFKMPILEKLKREKILNEYSGKELAKRLSEIVSYRGVE